VPNKHPPDLSLFLDILLTLEGMVAPYMIIGGFAAALYGGTRVTYDIDIVVDLSEDQINSLAAAYPPPRYYADPIQMHDSVRRGLMFNIIDAERGEKADLIPLTMDASYRRALQRRVRQVVELPGAKPFEVWCARAEDVITGKLMAWTEGRSRKHEVDIFEMMVFFYLDIDPVQSAAFDESYVENQAEALGPDVVELWKAVKEAAREAANQDHAVG
jgi:hypothetical protein